MPNWVFIDYYVEGDRNQLSKLYQTMRELENREESLLDNGFGKTWLGNLVAALGGDPLEISCRGKWTHAELNEYHLYFCVEAAWDELEDTRHFLEEQFPGINILFQCTGDGIHYTNDKSFRYSSRYFLDTEEEGLDYYSSLNELIADVEHITAEIGLQTLDDCLQALVRHSEANDDSAYSFGEFDIVD